MVARQHRQGCDGHCAKGKSKEGKEEGHGEREGGCSVTPQHVALSHSIEQFFKTLQGYDEYMQTLCEGEQTNSNDSKDIGDDDDAASSTTVITVNLFSASNLINSDVVGVSDPYVILSLPGQSVTSKTINNDLNPVFNQTFSLLWNGIDPLRVEVWDFDSFKPDGKHAVFLLPPISQPCAF
jgi:hypothetical protein